MSNNSFDHPENVLNSFLDRLDDPLTGSKLSLEHKKRILGFFRIIQRENQIQNLTRLTSPKEFVEGHLIDAIELVRSQFVQEPVMDLGSGVGVPGILAGILSPQRWILAESEVRKAEYLERAVKELSMDAFIRVVHGRGEKVADHHQVKTIVGRAVGKIGKIYGWFRKCSTWNTIVLLKGPGWDEEWAAFQTTKFRSDLEVYDQHRYTVGNEKRLRTIVVIRRVPRGTLAEEE